MKNDILYLHSIEAFLRKLPINYKQRSKPADIILKSVNITGDGKCDVA